MRIDRSTRLVLDASCLVAAAGSPTGGSAFLLSLCQRGFLRAVVSPPVLLEARRNVQENMDAVRLERTNQAGLAVQALSPGQFIKELLPTHPDCPSMR